MLQSLIQKAQYASIRKAFQKRQLLCPSCQAPAKSLPPSAEALIRCPDCGAESLAPEWLPASGLQLSANPDRIPPNTRIKIRQEEDGSRSWFIPPSGKGGFLLFFGTIWCLFTGFMSSVFLFGSGKIEGAEGPWAGLMLTMFFAVFWAVGIGTLYAAVRQKYAAHIITVGPDAVTLRRKLFNRIHTKSIPKHEVVTVGLVSFYEQNNTPVYGIEIFATKKSKLRFGSAMADEEKSWLAADLKRSILGAPAAPVSANLTPQERNAQRQEVFAIPFPAGSGGMLPTGIFLTLFGAVFFIVGTFVIDTHHGPRNIPHAADMFDLVFRLFSSMFNLMFGLVGFIVMLVGIGLTRHGIVTRHQERRLEGDHSQIAVRTYRQDRLIKERNFTRSEVSDIRVSQSGHVNNRPMVRLDLIVSGKAERLANWLPADTSTPWAEQVRLTIGTTQTPPP